MGGSWGIWGSCGSRIVMVVGGGQHISTSGKMVPRGRGGESDAGGEYGSMGARCPLDPPVGGGGPRVCHSLKMGEGAFPDFANLLGRGCTHFAKYKL